MKHIASFLLLLVLAACVSAQGDQYTVQGNPNCETTVTILAATQVLNLTLDGIGPIEVQPFTIFESRLAASNQTFTLSVQSGDSSYMIDTSLACPPAQIDAYAALEANVFKRMGWGPDEIEWFREVYTPLYGNPREFILSIAEDFGRIDTHVETSEGSVTEFPVEPLEATPEATETN